MSRRALVASAELLRSRGGGGSTTTGRISSPDDFKRGGQRARQAGRREQLPVCSPSEGKTARGSVLRGQEGQEVEGAPLARVSSAGEQKLDGGRGGVALSPASSCPHKTRPNAGVRYA